MGCGGSTTTEDSKQSSRGTNNGNTDSSCPPHTTFHESPRPDDLESIESADNIQPSQRRKSSFVGKNTGWLDLARAEAADEAEAELFIWDDLTVDFGVEMRQKALAMNKLHHDQQQQKEEGKPSVTKARARAVPKGKKGGVLFNDFIVDDFEEEVNKLQKSSSSNEGEEDSQQSGGTSPLSHHNSAAAAANSSNNNSRPDNAKFASSTSPSSSIRRDPEPQVIASPAGELPIGDATSPATSPGAAATTTVTTWIARNPSSPTKPTLPPHVPTPKPKDPAQKNKAPLRWFDVETHVGHPSRVKCLAIAPGEKEYVSCSNEDNIVTYGDIRTGHELGQFNGHRETVISATFSYCGKYLATTSRDNTLMLWDIVTQKAVFTFEHAKVVICCCFSRDSRFVGTGCQDKVCRVWDTRKGREVLTFLQHEGIIIAMAFSPDGKNIVSASSDKTLRVWSTSNGRSRATLTGHTAIILSCNFTNDGRRIISNDEKVIKIWSVDSAQNLHTITVDDFVRVRNLPPARKLTWTLTAPAPGKFARYVIAACNNRFVFFIDLDTMQEALSVYCKAPVYCLAPGSAHLIGCGDSFGNLYFITIGETEADALVDPAKKLLGLLGSEEEEEEEP